MNIMQALNDIGFFSIVNDLEILEIKECAKDWRILAFNLKTGEKFRIILERC